jgi:hypothetical protein
MSQNPSALLGQNSLAEPLIPPNTSRMAFSSRPYIPSVVTTPTRPKRAAMPPAMPGQSVRLRCSSLWGISSWSMIDRPRGFDKSDATLARKAFGARPMEQNSQSPTLKRISS